MSAEALAGSIQFSAGIPHEALREELAAGVPRRVIRPDLALGRGDRHVLLLSARHRQLHEQLEQRGAEVYPASDVAAAKQLLREAHFDVIAIDPEVPGAIQLVKMLKLRVEGTLPPALQRVRKNQPYLPVVVLPLSDDSEYAVVVRAPVLAYLESERRLSLVRAIMTFDAQWLMQRLSRRS
jgi:CheY-like chemotaxis protein